jgi:phage-related tail fiber protein
VNIKLNNHNSDTIGSYVRCYNITSGNVTLFAGHPGSSGTSGDNGLAVDAYLSSPQMLALDEANNQIYISESCRVRVVDRDTGIITTFAGQSTCSGSFTGEGGQATSASFTNTVMIALDNINNRVFILDSGNN